MNKTAEEIVSKVPAVTLGFWIIKIAATTLGETAGDAVTMTLNLGYLIGTAIFAALVVGAVGVQIVAKRFHPFLFWRTIIATTTVGTAVRRDKSVRRADPDLLRADALLYLARGKPRATVTTLLQVLRDLVLAFVAPRALLVAENLLLRQQVIVLSRQVKRPRLRHFDRWVLASIAGRFRDLLATILVVKPETVIR